MDRDLFTETVQAYRRRNPFRPFTVYTTDGRHQEVDHPEAIIVRGGVAVFLAPGNIPVIFDHESVSQVVGDLADRGAKA